MEARGFQNIRPFNAKILGTSMSSSHMGHSKHNSPQGTKGQLII